ncbi:MAG: aminoglycoside phosphotransferase family protein [Gammaproteobacteria bacterium]|nr:aminoglycoside phosphotransferase family protein [Gammaproteobacteria bacterium]
MTPVLAGKILEYFQLESQVEEITEIDMGHLHRVYQIKTASHSFIVKKLKPRSCDKQHVFTTEVDNYLENYTHAECIAAAFSAKSIPAVNAYFRQQQCIVSFDELDYVVYPYIEGDILMVEQMHLQQIEQVGQLIFQLHNCDIGLPAARPFQLFKPNDVWHSFLQRHVPQHTALFSDLVAQCQLCYTQQQYDVISHRDITCRNIIWQQSQYSIIDWELAGWIDPAVELLGVAINFSMLGTAHLDEDRFVAVLRGYGDVNHLVQRFESSFYGLINIWLCWVQYNAVLPAEHALKEALYSLKIISYICTRKNDIVELISNNSL